MFSAMKTESTELILIQPKLEPEDILISDEESRKQTFADALHHAVYLLKEEGAIAGTISDVLSSKSEEIGREIYRRLKEDVIKNEEPTKIVVKLEKVKSEIDDDVEVDFETVPQTDRSENKIEERFCTSSNTNDDHYACEVMSRCYDNVPWDMKVKAVTLATLYPRWSLKTIRKKTTNLLRTEEQLMMWKRAVKKSTISENYSIISDLTLKRFMDARSREQPVTTRLLQKWAIEASQQFLSNSFKFKASDTWIQRFQAKHNIRECKTTGFLKIKNTNSSLKVILP